MSHSSYQQINEIIKANKLYRFEIELHDLEENEPTSDRIPILKTIINKELSHKNTYQINEEKMQEHLKILKDS